MDREFILCIQVYYNRSIFFFCVEEELCDEKKERVTVK